jgi:hypothetical protein
MIPRTSTTTVSRLMLWWTVFAISIFSTRAAEQPAPDWHYFGDILSGRVDEQTYASITQGASLFAKSWVGVAASNKPPSCVSCHEIPMPGGSGITANTLVVASPAENSPTGFHVVGRRVPGNVGHGPTLLRTPPLFGLGLLESVTCNTGRLQFDQDCDRGGLGYRGRVSSIDEFVAFAFEKELGVELVLGKDPSDTSKITHEEIGAVATYLRHLAPPPKFPAKDPKAVERGERLFSTLGCASCHGIPTRRRSLSDAWVGIRLTPYTDYRQQKIHEQHEYSVRTAALWGVSYLGPPYFHDASANSLEEAILKHGLAAKVSSDGYRHLSASEKESLILFLRDL